MHIPHDYHIHSSFSFDCQMSLEQICERAIALGIPEICITDHVDFVPGDPSTGYFQPEAYFAAIEACREKFGDRLTIRAGAEMGEPHRFPYESEILADEYPFDFILGSLHWVQDEMVLQREYFTHRSPQEAYIAYFTELHTMVRVGGFDVLGHLDVVKRYGFDVYGTFDPQEFEEPIREVLRACVEVGIGLEVNTSTLRRPVHQPSPTLTVLKWYREMGGEIVTLGSDAHELAHIGYALADMVALLKAAGFTHVTSFADHQPYFVPLP